MLPDEWRLRVSQVLAGADLESIGLGAMGILLMIDLALFAAAASRFQRTRLILDE
jgi:hypothetical protein